LNIKADGPLSSGANTIPLSKFSWMSTYAGSKNAPYSDLSLGLAHPASAGYQTFTGSDQLVYTSTSNDNNSMPNGTEVQFKYAVSVPDNPSQLSGAYTTTVTYTMTE
jgi:spore coat protein U-like protein